MEATDFDRLSRTFARLGTRRGLLGFLAALSLAAPFGGLFGEEGEAAKGQKQGKRQSHRGDHGKQAGAATKQVDADKKKKKKCATAGQTTSKKRKRCCPGLVKQGNVCTRPGPPPSPPTPPPACTPGGCPAKQICHNGACQPCDVTCSCTAAACGQALQAALSGSASTIYVCPGRYQPPSVIGFTVNKSKTVIGAGQGTGAGKNTILDANNQARVLEISPGPAATVVLEQLLITDGNGGGSVGGGIGHFNGTLQMTDCAVFDNTSSVMGGGISSEGTGLEMTRCTVSGNSASGGSGDGGGIFVNGTFTLTDCLIEDNQANGGGGIFFNNGTGTLNGTTQVKENTTAGQGGGLFVSAGEMTIAATCRVTNNTAPAAGDGGGIYNGGATVTLQGDDPSPIVVNNCHDNCAGTGVGPVNCAENPTSC